MAYERDWGACSLINTRPPKRTILAVNGATTVNGHIAASKASGRSFRR